MPEAPIFLAWLADAALVWVLVRWIVRAGDPARHRWLRGALLSLLVLGNTAALLWIDPAPRVLVWSAIVFAAASTLLPDGPTRELGAALGKYRFAVYVTSVATVAGLSHVFLPITTFLTSPGEIGVHLGYLLSHHATAAMVVVYLAAALYAFALSPRMRTALTAVALVAVPLALVCAYAYPFGYPPMNGVMFEQIPIDDATFALRLLIDAVTVVVVALGTMWLAVRAGGARLLLALVLINLSLLGASWLSIARDETRESQAGTYRYSDRPIRYSKEKPNVLIVFLDRFMGGFVERILREDPQRLAELEGFTWYPRTLAAGENSIAGLHPLLGGYDYVPREMNLRNRPLRDLSVEAFAILPMNFARKGFAANLLNPSGLGFTMDGDCSVLDLPGVNCSHIPLEVTRRLAQKRGVPLQTLAEADYGDLLELLGLMRITPYSIRAVIYQKGPWRPFLDHSAGTTFREWAELWSWPELSRTDSDRGNLNVVFNMLPHEPYFLGDDCVPRSKRFNLPQAEIERRGFSNIFELQHYVAARCTMGLVTRYFAWMRKEGVYDNTRIVIVSDHGIVGPVEDHSRRAVAGKTQDNVFVRSRSVLFVKPRGRSGPLRVSERFVPNAEVPRIVCEEIGGCTNPFLGDRPIAALGREIPFFVTFVPWQFNLQEPTAFRTLGELVLVRPDPYDRDAWRMITPPPQEGH